MSPPKAYRTAASLLKKGMFPAASSARKEGLTSSFMRFAMGRPLIILLFEGQLSDHKSARLILAALPTGSTLIAD
jgi:hypothetical protein